MPQHTMTRRGFLKASLKGIIGAAVLGTGSVAYVSEVEPQWVDVAHVRLTLPRLSPAFHGYRIAQMSDIHADDWMTGERLQDIVALVNREQPDLVAMTGDFVTYYPHQVAENLIGALRHLAPRDASVAVLGNHDHWTDARGVRDVLHQSNIIDVSNRVYTLQRGGELLHICGVDDIWERQDRLDIVLANLPAAGSAVLLAHEPDFADTSAASGRFDLQISGHSHGGQVSIPLYGPPVLPYLGEKYPAGLYRVGTMWQYTNRGLGMVHPQVRFNSRPEVTIFELETP